MPCANCNSENLTVTHVMGRDLTYCNDCFFISYSKLKSGNALDHMAVEITSKVEVEGKAEMSHVILLNSMFRSDDNTKFEQKLSEWCGKHYLTFEYSYDREKVIFKRQVGVKPIPLWGNELARDPISILNFDYPIIVFALDFENEFRIEGRAQGRLIPYPVYLADKSIFPNFETPLSDFKSNLLSNQGELSRRLREYFRT